MKEVNQSLPRVAFRPQTLAGDLADLPGVRFEGVQCRACGVALLGIRKRCENCSSGDLEEKVFGLGGSVYSFTIQRYPPPAPNALPAEWAPRPVAWIDIDDGPRILAPLDCAVHDVAIGLRVQFSFYIGWHDDLGQDVVAFTARPCGGNAWER